MQAVTISAGIYFLLFAIAVQAAPLHDAIKAGDLVAARTLIAEGADPNELNFGSGTPLHIASVVGEFDIVEMLLGSGADVDSQEFGKNDTPLHWAALGGSVRVIERLILAGADIDAQNDYQNTPLHVAVDSSHAEAARRLIELGADTAPLNQAGNTAMHIAGKKQLFDIVELLIAQGAQLPPPDEIEPLLASASQTRGEELYSVTCSHCHALAVPNENMVGPSLWNVVGRQQAALENYDYSGAFERLDGIWSFESLNMLLLDSNNYFPGNKMNKTNRLIVSEIQDRADIISFLRLQSNEPVPLP